MAASKRTTHIILVVVVAAGVVLTCTIYRPWWRLYRPIVLDQRKGLVEDRSLLTPAHLDRLEVVLRRYGEPFERVNAHELRIMWTLSLDRDLLWNYTTKAEGEQSTK